MNGGWGATVRVTMLPIMIIGALLLVTGCQTLDKIATTRCSEALDTITKLRASADLYRVDDLAARLGRAVDLAEIWCPGFVDEPVTAVPVEPEVEVVPGGGEAP